MSRKTIGNVGEILAKTVLEYKGYCILETNFKCKAGEIDIIAKKGSLITFVEVKTRLTDAYGLGREAVDANKQKHIRRTAEYYLLINKKEYEMYDFQVIEISVAHLDGLQF